MYKKVNVVMLPTNEKSKIKLSDNNELDFFPGMMYIAEFDWKPQHLYITSNEEIKEGDWIYHLSRKEVFRIHHFDSSNNSKTIVTSDKDFLDLPNIFIKVLVSDCKKIIATTDKSITINNYDSSDEDAVVNCYLPQIPQQFIEKWIEEYNKGNVITEVMVEYNKKGIIQRGRGGERTITIRKIKESWNREEVIELCRSAHLHGEQGALNLHNQVFKQWIEENL